MQALKCFIVKFYILQSNDLLFHPEIISVLVSLTIVQYNTVLSKKVQNYFKVMINYIIAVTSSVRRNNVMPLCSCSCQFPFSQMILLASCIYIGLTFCLGSLLKSNPLHHAGWVWFELAWFCSYHDVSPQVSSVKVGR